jgi:hypothetical protein
VEAFRSTLWLLIAIGSTAGILQCLVALVRAPIVVNEYGAPRTRRRRTEMTLVGLGAALSAAILFVHAGALILRLGIL